MFNFFPTGWRWPARLLFVLGFLLPQLAQAQTPPTFDMALRVLAPTDANGLPFSHDVVVDAAGNSYISGHCDGSVRFDGRTISAGTGMMYVAKVDAAGSYRWIVTINNGLRSLGTSGTSLNLSHLALDNAGNLYVASIFLDSSLTLGTTTLTSSGTGPDLFVGKLDTNGNWLSAVRAGGPNTDYIHGLAVDGGGNAYITGRFSGTASFGSNVITARRASDMFVARLDAGGTWLWAVRGSSGGEDSGDDIGVDALGHVYITGTLATIGGQPGSTFIQNGFFVSRLNALTGAYQRVTTIPTGRFSYGRLAVDAAGACYLAGRYEGRLTFGPYTLSGIGVGISNENVCVAKLDAAGAWQWARTAGGNYGTYCSGIAIDDRSSIYIAGSFRGPVQFGATTLTSQNIALLWNDAYVAKLDAAGNWLWAVPAGGTKEDASTGFALGPAATPYIVGEYRSPSMAFGNLTTPGEPNEFRSTYVARLQANRVFITGDSVLCSGGGTQLTASTFGTVAGWRWNTGATTPSISITQPGTYTATVTFPGGYSVSETFRVRSIPPPTVAVTGAAGYLCPGTPRQLTAAAVGATGWRWSTGATTPSISVTQPGTYTVTATFSTSCTATAQAVVAGNAVAISGRVQLCPGQSTTLTAAATGGAVTGYRWNTGATTPTLLVGQAGTFQVTATFADGCQRTATHAVGPPVADVASVSGDTILCPGTTLTLTALNPDALTYRWSTGATTPTISVTQPGTYGVLLTYTGGCTSRDSLRLLPAPILPATLTLGADTTLCEEQPLLLRAPIIAGPGVSWRWSDGSTGPTLAVREAGTYSLQISTPCASLALQRRVGYTSCVRIPNVITPNGDRQNDRFVIQNLTSGDWALTLYNRWGRQVYHASAYRQDWGPGALAGTYYYLLKQVATNVTYKGWVEVVR